MDGGLGPQRDVSEFHPCQTFVNTRQTLTPQPTTNACKQELGDCTNAVSAADIAAAVAHPDVQRAIAAGSVIYGEDTRPVDGQVMLIEAGSKIEIGLPCRSTTCNPIPQGVQALADVLTVLKKQELGRAACKMTFPTAP
jgi:hypothetical protein